MKKIAIDARESGTSTGRYIDKLIENLALLKPGYRVVVLAKKHRMEYLAGIAPKFEIVESPYKEFTFSEQIQFLKQLRELAPDLVHFGMVQQPILYRGKVVTTMHDLTIAKFRNPAANWFVFTFKRFVYKWVNRIVARKSVVVIAISEYTKDTVARFADINSRKIVVTLEAADKITDEPEPVENLDENSQFIMYVGRPQPHKNLNALVDAFVMLKTTHPDLQLILAGKRDLLFKRLERQVQAAKIEGVLFPGFVTEGQLRWLYEHTACYAFPSLSEGFGLPGLEALAHGAPVAASNTTSIPEVLGDAAEYFDPDDPFAIASGIARVLDNPKLASKLRSQGPAQAAKFSWKRMAEQTLAVYKDVIG